MATKVIMPKQGLQMTEGTIISWLVKEGGKAVKDEPLFEMETDKLTITMDAPESGTLLKIVRGEGETVPITETIAIVGEPGEDISKLLDAAPHQEKAQQPVVQEMAAEVKTPPAERTAGGRVFISPRAKALAQEKSVDYAGIAGSGTDGMIVEKDVRACLKSGAKATPLAKKVAAINDVALEDVKGTGAHQKIVRADILGAMTARKKDARGETLVPFAGMRKVIAGRMVESLHTAAQTTHQISVDMTEAGQIREAYKKAGKKVSYNDIIAHVVCRALRDYPMMNAELAEEGIRIKDYVNLGIAVALDNGLIVPVINDADLMSVEEIGMVTKELAEKAKAGKLKPDEYKGGTFTISNLGMFGLDSFVAIINRPESGILAVGKITQTPVATDSNEVVIRPMMVLTLTYDHRVVDGAPAAQFLARVKQYLEQPYLLF
ncbi:MAG: dihydrolipoamide acetyltransferase family protein [Eubacteriales bacterium]|nr:dihydrolipoamide acetyltransferase family protein [Eubacteriales bacterium]